MAVAYQLLQNCRPENYFFLKKNLLRKQAQKKAQENGENSPTDESGFDGWSDDVRANSQSKMDDWGEDTSQEAVQKRMETLGEGVKGLTYNDDLDKSVEDRVNIFFKFVKVGLVFAFEISSCISPSSIRSK